MGDMQGA
jgi:hypothetical protein